MSALDLRTCSPPRNVSFYLEHPDRSTSVGHTYRLRLAPVVRGYRVRAPFSDPRVMLGKCLGRGPHGKVGYSCVIIEGHGGAGRVVHACLQIRFGHNLAPRTPQTYPRRTSKKHLKTLDVLFPSVKSTNPDDSSPERYDRFLGTGINLAV